ncbi:MAG: hydrogenase maturation nickel metallochaperone HypA [Thermodesulfovibrionales bacterium]|nr:hydrogenase maturation nickel metallochaperone HypA [Thermodesulfovibrionales bacterium]
MHEASIALTLLERVVEECKNNGCSAVKNVKIEVGRASGVLPDALLFVFNAIKSDTIASSATLEIDETILTAKCNNCQKEFTTDESYIFECPFCNSNSFSVLRGRELNIIEIEVE